MIWRKGAGDGPAPTVAAITMVRDEAAMLPRWVAHYSRQVGVENLFVIDDNSTDGGTDGLPCPVLRIPPITKQQFEPARMGMLSGLAASLLNAYDAVLFTDADEFVVADPDRFGSLRDFVAARRGSSVLGVMGLNVVHLASEPDLDPARPILEQRSCAKFLPLMCKPSLTWVPAAWRWASHGIMAPYTIDPDLYMFHMKFADRRLLMAAGDRRKEVVEMDGRAATTSWRLGGNEMVALLDRISESADVDAAQPFSPPAKKLKEIVEKKPDGSWRAVGGGQMQAMERRPLVRVPERFRSLV